MPDTCLIRDVIYEKDGSTPRPRVRVQYFYLSRPVILTEGGLIHGTDDVVTTDADGVYEIEATWASESTPNDVQLLISYGLDDGQVAGVVPSITGPVDISTLKASHGWTSVDDVSPVTVEQGPPGMVWRGAWDSATTYSPTDVVSYSGASWIALQMNTNVTPVAGANWALVAQAGALAGAQNVNLVYAGPSSGGSATPAFRAMVDADLPAAISASRISGTVPLANLAGITDAQIASANKDGSAGTASLRTLGTGVTQAAAGNDGRLTELTSSALHRLLWKLHQNVADCAIVVVGDSTGDETTEWVYLLTQWLATQYPAYTVTYRLWTSTASTDYAAPTTIQTGTGSQTLAVYNASVSGTNEMMVLSPHFTTKIVTPRPDVVFISHGKNFLAVDANNTPDHIRARYFSLTESIRTAIPTAGIVCIAQCPNTADTYMETRLRELARVCELRGYGFINVFQAFKDYGTAWATDLMRDPLHPNATGEALWAAEVERAFSWNPHHQPRGMSPSSFDEAPCINLLTRGDFSGFTPPSAPNGWTGTNVAYAKDTTNYESLNGYAVRLTPVAAGIASMQQDIANYQAYANRWVTLAVRLRNNTGAANIHVGRIAISDGITTITSVQDAFGFGNYVWRAVTMQVGASPLRLRAIIYAADSSGTGSEDCSVDCAFLVPGILPRRAIDATLDAGRGYTWTGAMLFSGHVGFTAQTKTANYALTSTDPPVLIANAANLTITLPAASGGGIFLIKNGPAGESTTLASAGGLIEGYATYLGLVAAGASVWVFSNGTNWFVA